MLTAEQIKIRKTGIGASEVSALTGSSPYRQAIDVWLEKTGRHIQPEEDEATEMWVGSGLEGALVDLYTTRTGKLVDRPASTLVHPEFPHVLASPDGFVVDEDRGLECKVVGARMTHHWAHDTIPDYVVDQVQQNMAVTGLEAWDVVALVGGTDFRIRTIEADVEHQARLIEACETFWITHVEPDEPPETEDPEKRRAYLLARYPGSEATKAIDVSSAPDADEIAEAIRWYRAGRDMLELLTTQVEHLENMLVERIGDAYGIEGPWGKAINFQRKGSAKWKEIAEELAGGPIPDKTIEQHRGAPGRTFRFYPFTPKRPGAKTKGTR